MLVVDARAYELFGGAKSCLTLYYGSVHRNTKILFHKGTALLLVHVTPFLHLQTLGRRTLNRSLANILPVGGKNGTTGLVEGLHHGSSLILRCVGVNVLEYL